MIKDKIKLKRRKDRIIHLEGLRGLAALIVVFHHFAFGFYPAIILGNLVPTHFSFEKIIYGSPLALLFSGHFAVSVFFILSGYVLSYIYFKKKDKDSLQQLAIRRFFRLAIPSAASVAIAYILLSNHLFFGKNIASITFSQQWLGSYYNFTPNFFNMLYEGFISVFFTSNVPQYNNVLWTMYYELLGSFIIFSFLGLFGNMKKRYLLYTILIVIFIKTYYLGFILGMILSDLTVDNTKIEVKGKRKYIYVLLLVVAMILGAYPTSQVNKTMYAWLNIPFFNGIENIVFFNTVAGFMLFISILKLSWIKRILRHSFFAFLGRISFSLYLTHILIIFSFSSYFFYQISKYLSYNISFLLTFCFSIIIMFAVAYVFTEYIDDKGVTLSKKIAKVIYLP